MVRQSAQTPGHALVKRAEDKILKHDEAYRQTGIVFEKGGGDKINQCGPDGFGVLRLLDLPYLPYFTTFLGGRVGGRLFENKTKLSPT